MVWENLKITAFPRHTISRSCLCSRILRYSLVEKIRNLCTLISELMNKDDIDEIICATDAGREASLSSATSTMQIIVTSQ